MKQTAVEWLESELKNSNGLPYKHFEEIINQAKAMEKEQIIKAHTHGWNNAIQGNFISSQEYYKKTFKSE